MDAIKEKLNPWLGEPRRKQSEGRVTYAPRNPGWRVPGICLTRIASI
nr:hypothetical protein [Pelodictyon luteolum]